MLGYMVPASVKNLWPDRSPFSQPSCHAEAFVKISIGRRDELMTFSRIFIEIGRKQSEPDLVFQADNTYTF